MTEEQFTALVARLEEQARSSPVGYRLRVLMLALLGYGYLAVMLLLTLVLFGITLASALVLKALALKLIIPMAAFLWIVVRAMWVKIEPPEGRELKRKDAPRLFSLVDALRRKLRAPRFHRILVTDEFNAAVVQVPRLGIFGWYRNYLLIGLPLMKSLTREQFAAVLAHEFGHLAGGHGRLSNWLYRMRLSWARLLEVLEANKSGGRFLYRPFFHWFAPYFNAYSFPLARANEYQADAAAASLTSSRVVAEALTGVSIVGTYLGERYWPRIHGQADDAPQPAFLPYARLGDSLSQAFDGQDAETWLQWAMSRETGVDDTHPSLADRLKALGESPQVTPPDPGRAADSLLGEALEPLTSEFDRRWYDDILPAWTERYREVQEGRARLAELDVRASAGESLSSPDACERALLTESYGSGVDAAFGQLQQLHAEVPDDARVNYELGLRLLRRDAGEGVGLIERAIEADAEYFVPGCETLCNYHWANGRQEQAQLWHGRMQERVQLLQAAQYERDHLFVKDRFDHHRLADDVIEQMKRQLRSVQGVRKAWFVRKLVQHLPEYPCYVLGYTATPWWRLRNKRRVAEIQQRILATVSFPGETLVLNVEGDNSRFARKLRFRRGARIL